MKRDPKDRQEFKSGELEARENAGVDVSGFVDLVAGS